MWITHVLSLIVFGAGARYNITRQVNICDISVILDFQLTCLNIQTTVTATRSRSTWTAGFSRHGFRTPLPGLNAIFTHGKRTINLKSIKRTNQFAIWLLNLICVYVLRCEMHTQSRRVISVWVLSAALIFDIIIHLKVKYKGIWRSRLLRVKLLLVE